MNPLFDKLERLGLRPWIDPNERAPVSRDDVEELEFFFGFRFPPLYVEFLLRYGESHFGDDDLDHTFFDVPKNWNEITDYGATDITLFFGLVSERENGRFSLKREIEIARSDRLPFHFVPICMSDGLSTHVYISCREQDYGYVYALSKTQVWDVKSAEQACEVAFHIADSFEEFLENLHIVSSDEPVETRGNAFAFVAIQNNDVAFLQNIVDAGEIETHREPDGQALPLLQAAIISGLIWPVEFLLARGAKTEKALRFAIGNGHLDAIRLLLAHGVDVNARQPLNNNSKDWNTPLIQAVRRLNYDKKYEIVRLLVEAGADVEARDSQGKTALDYVHPLNQKMRAILTLEN